MLCHTTAVSMQRLVSNEPAFYGASPAKGRDFLWTLFLWKYIYSPVIRLDFNPWATTDFLELQAMESWARPGNEAI